MSRKGQVVDPPSLRRDQQCKGRMSITTAEPVKRKSRKLVTLGSKKFTIAANKKQNVNVRFSKSKRARQAAEAVQGQGRDPRDRPARQPADLQPRLHPAGPLTRSLRRPSAPSRIARDARRGGQQHGRHHGHRVAKRASSNGAQPGQLDSFNPATGELVGSVPTITPDQVQSIVDDVAGVQPFWAQLSLADRARYLRRAAQVLLDHSDEIAELISREQGKPRLESYTMELLPTIDALHWCADNGPRILADEPIPHPAADAQAEEEQVRVRADRRRGRDRAVELPVVDPVRRGGDRADGGQRRRAEAGLADAADRPAHPGGVRARRASRRV